MFGLERINDYFRRKRDRGRQQPARLILQPYPALDDVVRQIQRVPKHMAPLPDVQTTAFLLAEAALVQTALALSTVDLVAAAFTPAPALVIGSLTLATFTGYAQQSITTAPAPFIDQINGGVSIALPGHTFAQSGTGIDNTVFGYVLQTAGGVIVQSGVFPAPIVMNQAGKAIPLSVLINWQT